MLPEHFSSTDLQRERSQLSPLTPSIFVLGQENRNHMLYFTGMIVCKNWRGMKGLKKQKGNWYNGVSNNRKQWLPLQLREWRKRLGFWQLNVEKGTFRLVLSGASCSGHAVVSEPRGEPLPLLGAWRDSSANQWGKIMQTGLSNCCWNEWLLSWWRNRAKVMVTRTGHQNKEKKTGSNTFALPAPVFCVPSSPLLVWFAESQLSCG